jgi:lipoprotein-releasing system ATP-binding protein
MNRKPPERPETAGILLQAAGLTKSFWLGDKEIPVLRGIDLEIREGETLAILGASGVGKTTLLHILGALDRPSGGHVVYRGMDQFSRSDKDLARFRNREIGFVFQFHYLLSDLSALENTLLPARIGGMPKREAEPKARELLRELGLAGRMEHRPGKLSGGEQQRVAVARAVMMDPRIIFADEPTGNLDTQNARAVEELLMKLRDTRGVAVVAVTHNPAFAARMDRQVHMSDGRLLETRPAALPTNENGAKGAGA